MIDRLLIYKLIYTNTLLLPLPFYFNLKTEVLPVLFFVTFAPTIFPAVKFDQAVTICGFITRTTYPVLLDQ